MLKRVFEVDMRITFWGCPKSRGKLILHCSNDEVYQMVGLVPQQATTSLAHPQQAGVYVAPFGAQISVAPQGLYRC
jgi:hypothetical protein